jgi:hypothetical protein
VLNLKDKELSDYHSSEIVVEAASETVVEAASETVVEAARQGASGLNKGLLS